MILMIFNPRQAVANVFAWFRQQLIINIRFRLLRSLLLDWFFYYNKAVFLGW